MRVHFSMHILICFIWVTMYMYEQYKSIKIWTIFILRLYKICSCIEHSSKGYKKPENSSLLWSITSQEQIQGWQPVKNVLFIKEVTYWLYGFTWGLLELSVLGLPSLRVFPSLFRFDFILDIQFNNLLTLSPCSFFSSSTVL